MQISSVRPESVETSRSEEAYIRSMMDWNVWRSDEAVQWEIIVVDIEEPKYGWEDVNGHIMRAF